MTGRIETQSENDEGLLFAQGLQMFFLREHLKGHKFGTALTQSLFQRFFADWSEVVRGGERVPRRVTVPPDLRKALAKSLPSGRDLGEVTELDLESVRPAHKGAEAQERENPSAEKLLESVSVAYRDLVRKYVGGAQSDMIVRLLGDENLGALLTVPFPRPAAPMEVKEPTEPADKKVAARRAAPAPTKPSAVLHEAMAREAMIPADMFDPSKRGHVERITKLDLSGLDIIDIGPFASLTNLCELRLTDTQVSDITPLASLTNLRFLLLDFTPVSEIAPLASLVKLLALGLSHTRVTDIAPLDSLVNLRALSLGGTRVSDIAPLASLVNLRELYLMDTQVSDITPLAALTKLERLFLPGRPVSDEQVRFLGEKLPNCSIHR